MSGLYRSTEALIIKFVAQHLWDPAERFADPSHGMPESVAEELMTAGRTRRQPYAAACHPGQR